MTSKLLSNIYYNPSQYASFSSKAKLLKAAKTKDPSLNAADIETWLKKQLTYTLHKPIRRYFKRNRIVTKYPSEQFQADLVELRTYSSHNNGFNYILTVIDVFSNFAYAIPIKNKTMCVKLFETSLHLQFHKSYKQIKAESLSTTALKSCAKNLKYNILQHMMVKLSVLWLSGLIEL